MIDNYNSLQLLRGSVLYETHEDMIQALNGNLKYNANFKFKVGEPFILFYKDADDKTCVSLFIAIGEKAYEEVSNKAAIDDINKELDALEGRMTTAETDIDALEGRMDVAEDKITDLETAKAQIANLCGFTYNETEKKYEYHSEKVKSESLAKAIDEVYDKIKVYTFNNSNTISFQDSDDNIYAHVNISDKNHAGELGSDFDDTNALVVDDKGLGVYFDIIRNPNGKLVLRKAINKGENIELERQVVPVADVAMSGSATDVTLVTEVLSTHNLEEAIVKLANTSASHTIIEIPENEKVLVLKKDETTGQTKYTLSLHSWDATKTLTDAEKHIYVPTVAASVNKAELDQVVDEASTTDNAPSTKAVYDFVNANGKILENAIDEEKQRATTEEQKIRTDVNATFDDVYGRINAEATTRANDDTKIRTDVNATIEQVYTKIAEVETEAKKHTEIEIALNEDALKADKVDNVYSMSIEKNTTMPTVGIPTEAEDRQIPSYGVVKRVYSYIKNAEGQLQVEDAAIRAAYKLADDGITAAYKLADTGIETAYKFADAELKGTALSSSSSYTIYGVSKKVDEAKKDLLGEKTWPSKVSPDDYTIYGVRLRVDNEISNRESADTNLQTSINNEKTRAQSEEGRIEKKIDDAIGSGGSVETQIANAIAGLDGQANVASINENNIIKIKAIVKEQDGKLIDDTSISEIELAKVAKTGKSEDIAYGNSSNVMAELEKIEGEATVEGSIKKAVADAKAELTTEIEKVNVERKIEGHATSTANITTIETANAATQLYVDVKKEDVDFNALKLNANGLYVPDITLDYNGQTNKLTLTKGGVARDIQLIGVTAFKSITYDPQTHELVIIYETTESNGEQTVRVNLEGLVPKIIGTPEGSDDKVLIKVTETSQSGVFTEQITAELNGVKAQDIECLYHFDPEETITNVDEALQHLNNTKVDKSTIDEMAGTATIATSSDGVVFIKGGVKQVKGVISNNDQTDIILAKVATTGKASDIAIEDASGKISATDVEGALQEIASNIAITGVMEDQFIGVLNKEVISKFPAYTTAENGKVLKINGLGTGLEWGEGGSATGTLESVNVNGVQSTGSPTAYVTIGGANIQLGGYSKPTIGPEAISSNDTVNQAIGKLEYRLDSLTFDMGTY